MILTQLGRTDYRRMRWKNGLGWTTELALRPADASLEDPGFDWRLSVAEVDADCEFSAFAGYDRSLMLLDGGGMELRFGGTEAVLLRMRGQGHDFAGEATVRCRLLAGPCRDFNVMVRRGLVSHHVTFRPLVGPMVFFPETRVTWAIHLASGHAQVQNAPGRAPLEAGDTLVLESADGPAHQCVIAGSGEVVLVRLELLGAASPRDKTLQRF